MQSDSKPSRPIELEPLVHPKEKIYFAVCIIVSLAIYAALAMIILSGSPIAGPVIFYLVLIILGVFIAHGLFLGQVRGNGVRVSRRQFPELMTMAEEHSRRLNMETPDIFVLQAGGILNAFATRFLGRNFVILYSDVLALATQKGERAVSFVLAHELGHVKRKHMTRRALLYPAMVFPFLGGAYSRACEYTCDRLGNALQPDGSVDGLLVLAAGRDLYTQVNSAEYSNQRETETGFFVAFSEILSTHPNLPKRVAALDTERPGPAVPSLPAVGTAMPVG
ncbi:MAG TPA: M48 family metallopeptidase [Gemmatimonadaceae bacterium]|jgi:Zn-dependent protease with chaperone function|nr:M48 family metallopeptidase [Gemmatimonadaceae bacterium]